MENLEQLEQEYRDELGLTLDQVEHCLRVVMAYRTLGLKVSEVLGTIAKLEDVSLSEKVMMAYAVGFWMGKQRG